MSRSGKRPIAIPKGVQVEITAEKVSVKGPKGNLEAPQIEGVDVKVVEGQVHVSAQDPSLNRVHGLQRALVSNMLVGCGVGFEKRLELIGVGYRAAIKGNLVELMLGYSHPTAVEIPKGLTVVVEKNTTVIVTGIDRQQVGQLAADIRRVRPPEPYKGKGVRYVGEFVRKKAGKSAKK